MKWKKIKNATWGILEGFIAVVRISDPNVFTGNLVFQIWCTAMPQRHPNYSLKLLEK